MLQSTDLERLRNKEGSVPISLARVNRTDTPSGLEAGGVRNTRDQMKQGWRESVQEEAAGIEELLRAEQKN